MPLTKSKGQMYHWCTHLHNPLAGECMFECAYCSINNAKRRHDAVREKYSGPIRLIEKELQTNYGDGKTIFICNCTDLFAPNVSSEIIQKILNHCIEYPKNMYVFQTKNPFRYIDDFNWPETYILGCTIESNRHYRFSMAPIPKQRVDAMMCVYARKFITVEPILDFDVFALANMITVTNPIFVNIGADSKNNNLPEPSSEKVLELIKRLKDRGIEIREKSNLDRLF